jgi:CheY-like chemotaxis protein
VALKKILWSESIRSRVESGRSDFLARASVRALCAVNAAVFFDLAESERPDLIVLPADPLDLPAVEICRRIRSDERTRSIPILALAPRGEEMKRLAVAGCDEVLDQETPVQDLQEKIASVLGVKLRRFVRYPIVLPVARGRIFHEFLGYTSQLSEGGMGFETISRVRSGEYLPLRIYRNTEEKPIGVTGRVAAVRPNIETGVGYAVGIEFLRLATTDRLRLVDLFPRDPSLSWTSDVPSGAGSSDPSPPGH